jgi:hypothetical protein
MCLPVASTFRLAATNKRRFKQCPSTMNTRGAKSSTAGNGEDQQDE